MGDICRRFRRTLRAWLGPATIDFAYWLVARRDWAAVQRLGRALGSYGYAVGGDHRRTALRNLRQAFGDELPEARCREIARGVFQHLVSLFLEAMRFSMMSLEERDRFCPVEGEEHFAAALAQGNGAVIATAHLGNWELGALHMIGRGHPLLPLSRLPSNPRLARKVAELRTKEGFEVIQIHEGTRGVLRALRQNMLVPVLPDRFARGRGVPVPFFGRDAHVWPTAALLAQRANCPILPAYTLRQPDGRYLCRILPPVELQVTDDRDADLRVNTARTMAILEQQVREFPEQYTWTYDLWREPPPPDSLREPVDDPVVG